MKEVECYEITKWAFDCPCGHFNELDEDPTNYEEVTCEDCCEDFIIT